MQQNINEIEIKGIKYVPKSSQPEALPMNPSNAVIVRCQNAGVFFGCVREKNLKEGWIILTNARRLWYWSGAASLSQLAVDGTSKPGDCKFPVAVPEIQLCQVIEIIPCTEKAIESLTKVAIWSA